MSIGIGDIDIVELDISELDTGKPSVPAPPPPQSGMPNSTSGGGLELLMNTSGTKKSSGPKNMTTSIDDLEKELNDLTDTVPSIPKSAPAPTKSSLFDVDTDTINVSKSGSDSAPSSTPSLGKILGETTAPNTKTWDGYGKFNDIPVNPAMDESVPLKPAMSKEEVLREKFKYIRKLEGLEQKGVTMTKKYTMESDLAEMQGEYETHIAEKERTNSVKFQGKMLMAAVTGLEFLNNKIDPFDVNLDGWGEQVNENVSDYDEIFSELHEKYKSKAKMAPELKLLFQLGGSAIMVHMTNSMFKTAVPGMDDIMRQNPDLMKQFSQAAVNSMGQSNPGFTGFMNDVAGPAPQRAPQRAPPSRPSAPPKDPRNAPRSAPPQSRPQPPPFSEGVSINTPFSDVNDSVPSKRVDMQGPSDISSILSNIKKKQDRENVASKPPRDTIEVGSSISVQEMAEMKKSLVGNGSRGRRRPRKEEQIIDL
jgi:hypothetical protein